MLNVFKSFSWSKRYYLSHPWEFIKDVFYNFRAAWLRATKGYCYTDVWNMDNWFLEVIPSMLRHMADYGSAYPGFKPFETEEKWHDWLHSVADVLESLQEDNWYSQNEYAEDFYKTSWEKDSYSEKEKKEIWQLYSKRMNELGEQRQQLLKDTFAQLQEHFFSLWD